MRSRACIVVSVFILMQNSASSVPLSGSENRKGAIRGSTGGNERDLVVYRRGGKVAHYEITYGNGAYRVKGLDPGEVMVLSQGRVASRVPVRAGLTTTLDFANASSFSQPNETWSPARQSFGQTFVADGSQIQKISFWIPTGKHRLALSLREAGPHGRSIGERILSDPVTWVVQIHFREGEWKTVPGKTYYIDIRNMDGKTWNVGMPGRGDVYPNGEGTFDGEPQLDCDLSLTIESDVSGLVETAAARDGLGFIEVGRGSGLSRSAGQTFVATTSNIISAYANAGWGGRPRRILDFEFAVRETGPDGRQIGPTVTAPMISDWGQTAVWFPDEVNVIPGKRYYLSMRRADGGPFYAYLSRDVYPAGHAWRNGKREEGFDLTFSVRGERIPDSITYPFNVRVDVDRTAATLTWETGRPAMSQVCLHRLFGPPVLKPASDHPTKTHRVTLRGLLPGTDYSITATSRTGRPRGFPVFGRPRLFRTKGQERSGKTKSVVVRNYEPRKKQIPLKNPGFEEDDLGWSVTGSLARRFENFADIPVPESKTMLGYGHRRDPRSDETVPRKIDPAERSLILQEVRLTPGKSYLLSALVFAREKEGGWQRTNRARLIAYAPEARGNKEGKNPLRSLQENLDLRESRSTSWYSTGGEWRRFRLRFKARGPRAAIGVELYRWWALAEDAVFVDSVRLEEME